MIEYKELLQATLKTARKCYICEPSREGKREWLRLIKECLKEISEIRGGLQ